MCILLHNWKNINYRRRKKKELEQICTSYMHICWTDYSVVQQQCTIFISDNQFSIKNNRIYIYCKAMFNKM